MSKRSSLFILSALALLAACGKGTAPTDGRVDESGAERPDHDPFLAVNRMLVAHGCANCHAADYARVGPAMRDVAMIHDQATDPDRQRLADVILNGGKGRWGMAIMPAQKQVTPEQAKQIVTEILALKDIKTP